ncbi:MAG TPA: amino acid permease [Candidatus Dormibacteraeota bacterium]|jgi:APA family basic amino acid/polyamine antiporter|nr:amino acid permease [Candidatus Dormibacteraeota bacterium]
MSASEKAAAFAAQQPTTSSPDKPQLRRILGMRDLVLLIIGTVIGSGIFLVPGTILKSVGNSLPVALSVWIIGGVLSLLGALTYGELTAMKPEAGGLYVYIRDCFGPLMGFLFGWTFFFVISTGAAATLSVAFSTYLREFIPLTTWSARLVSVLVIVVIAAVNVRGTRQSADLQNLTTAIKVFALLTMGTALLWFGKGSHIFGASPAASLPAGSLFSGIGLAMVSVLWAYEGWQYATFSAGETLNPQRNFPLAFLGATLALMGIYLFANLGYVAALGAHEVANSNRVAATALAAAISPAAAKLVTVAILISMFSAANSVTLTAPRVYYAMAKDGLFFQRLAEIHPKFGTPAFAVITGAVWAALLAASGTFEQLLTYVVFVSWSCYALAAASIFVYRKRQPNALRPYRVPGYPWTPLLFILVTAAFVANTVYAKPREAAVGLGIVLAGAPAYMIWRKRPNTVGE